MTDHTAEPLRWHYGPTDANPDPGRAWHYGCGREVMFFDDGAVCECGATDMNGALMARPAEPVPSTPTEPRRVVVCAKNDLPHVENDNCVDAKFNGVVQVGDQITTDPLARGGVVSIDALPSWRLGDLGRTLVKDTAGRQAERERAAYERGKAEGIAERLIDRDTLAAIVCAVRDDPGHQAMDEDVVCGNCEEIAKEIQQHVIAKTGGGQDGQ